MKESKRSFECDMMHCVPWLIHTCDMTHTYVRRDSSMRVTSQFHVCDMTHSYVWHDSCICMKWLIHVWHDSFIYVTWLIHACDMTHSSMFDMTHWFMSHITHLYMGHDSLTCVAWLIQTWDIVHSCVWHDSFMCVTRLIHSCNMTQSRVWPGSFIVWYDSFISVIFTNEWVNLSSRTEESSAWIRDCARIQSGSTCHITHSYVCYELCVTHLYVLIQESSARIGSSCSAMSDVTHCHASHTCGD